MRQRIVFVFLVGIFLVVLLLGLTLIKVDDFNVVSAQGTLSCEVRNFPCGDTRPVEIFQMSGATNAHAALPGQGYTHRVCCGGVTNLSNACTGNFAVVLRLSGVTNAHVQQTGSYPQRVCVSVPSGGNFLVSYRLNTCVTGETTLASMSGATNAHVGNAAAYPTKICAIATEAPLISVSVSDGLVTYGIMTENTSKTTLPGELNDMQIATNNGNVTANFNIKGQDATGGGCVWILAAANGSNQYVHQFCNATDHSCVSPPTNYIALLISYQTLKTGMPVGGTVNFHLRLITPNPSTCYGQQSVNVTIQATQ